MIGLLRSLKASHDEDERIEFLALLGEEIREFIALAGDVLEPRLAGAGVR